MAWIGPHEEICSDLISHVRSRINGRYKSTYLYPWWRIQRSSIIFPTRADIRWRRPTSTDEHHRRTPIRDPVSLYSLSLGDNRDVGWFHSVDKLLTNLGGAEAPPHGTRRPCDGDGFWPPIPGARTLLSAQWCSSTCGADEELTQVTEIAARPFLQLDGARWCGSSFRRGPLPRTVWFSVVFIPRGRRERLSESVGGFVLATSYLGGLLSTPARIPGKRRSHGEEHAIQFQGGRWIWPDRAPPGSDGVCSWAGAGENELGRDKGFRPTSAQCFTFFIPMFQLDSNMFFFTCSNLDCMHKQKKPSMTCSKTILSSYILFI
jgi:hypothetical protein